MAARPSMAPPALPGSRLAERPERRSGIRFLSSASDFLTDPVFPLTPPWKPAAVATRVSSKRLCAPSKPCGPAGGPFVFGPRRVEERRINEAAIVEQMKDLERRPFNVDASPP
ncbi:hypothetical protein EYF80_033006 [Liparis tanakae]|uniref:Uncharacterized protein n=1 Tax=Liparis tanakae TaxID=230148 RepID=A0A4Z2GSV5_9TELE|nr:hypothetical protein EYF80_033006 [Liparis tanakae]